MLTKRPLSLAALTVLELDPVEMVRCAAQAGYSHVGLRLVPATPDEPAYDTIGGTPLIRATRAALEGTGVRVLDVEILRLKPETRVADFRPFMETGALLGASQVLIAGNDPDEARLADNFGRACELAAGYGLAANLEPMPWTNVRDIGQAERIIAASGRDDGGILIDPIHFDRAGSTIGDIAAIPAQRFRYAQLCDAPAARPATTEEILFQARAERLAPGAGGLPLRELIGALPAGVPLSLEVPQQALAKTVGAVERARRLLQATQALLAAL
jgi:sugar phosphate isomerase/epimerase